MDTRSSLIKKCEASHLGDQSNSSPPQFSVAPTILTAVRSRCGFGKLEVLRLLSGPVDQNENKTFLFFF